MFKVAREILLYFIIAIIILFIFSRVMNIQDQPESLKFDDFMKRAESGKIVDAVINNNDGTIQGRQISDNKKYRTDGPVNHPELYYDLLRQKGVKVSFSNAGNGWWAVILPNLGFLILFLVFWFFILNQMQNTGNKALSFGKSRARLHTDDRTKTTFDDVAGEDEPKKNLWKLWSS